MDQVHSIRLATRQLRDISAALAAAPRQIEKVLRGAVRDTSRQVRTRISSKIRDRVTIKKGDIDPYINIVQAGTAPQARVLLSESARLPLKYFGARQTKQGVTYKIAKGARRQLAAGAFVVAKLGAHAFRRFGPKRPATSRSRYAGQLRQKIQRLHGPSPWAVFVLSRLETPTAAEASELLAKNLDRRTNLILLRLAGKVATPSYESN